MNKIATNIRSLILINQFHFSKDIFLSGSNPIRDRVMSTPTWPVPYYQRLTKAYPIRCNSLIIEKQVNQILEESTTQLMILPGLKLNSSLT